MSRPLWLELTESQATHGDIRLTFGPTVHFEDSYYLTLDQNLDPFDESRQKATRVLAQLLRQWISRLQRGNDVYLPVGFSDESMTWIHAVQEGDSARLTLGWSDDEGWGLAPSDPGNRNPARFYPFEKVPPLTIYRPRLLSLLRSNIASLQAAAGDSPNANS